MLHTLEGLSFVWKYSLLIPFLYTTKQFALYGWNFYGFSHNMSTNIIFDYEASSYEPSRQLPSCLVNSPLCLNILLCLLYRFFFNNRVIFGVDIMKTFLNVIIINIFCKLILFFSIIGLQCSLAFLIVCSALAASPEFVASK